MNLRKISFIVSNFSEMQLLNSSKMNRLLFSTQKRKIIPLSYQRTNIPFQLIYKGSQFMCTTTNNEHKSGELYSVNLIKNEIKKDIAGNFKNYSLIRKSFINLIEQKSFNNENQEQLIDILYCLSQYPFFILPNSIILDIYKVICQNMHLKSVETMNRLLLFILIADQNSSQSPIFLEFIKFYVRDDLEVLKYTYQIDISKLSLYEGIKQFLGKLLYRGFLSRTPPYDRGINVIYPQRTLNLLTSKQILRDSMMVKKINYFIFLQIKEYYEQNMNQNLYHRNKLILIQRFNRDLIKFLCYSIQSTHHQAINMRELYMKLYLALPNIMQPQNTVYNNKQQKEHMIQCQKSKYRNVIYLYNFSNLHIQRLDHLKIQEIDEKIEVVIQFVQQVSENLNKILKMSQQKLLSLSLSIQEILMIIIVQAKLNKDTQSYSVLQKVVQTHLSPYLFWLHFQLFIELFESFKENRIFNNVLLQYQYYQMLTLTQIQLLAESLNPYLIEEKVQTFKIIWGNLLKRILQIEYQIVSGRQMAQFLQIYSKFVNFFKDSIFSQSIQRREQVYSLSETLRFFMMRYISDHHKQFSLRQFQFILKLLIQLPSQTWSNFDDKDNNYPDSIFQELRPYFTTVKLLIDSDIRAKIQPIY